MKCEWRYFIVLNNNKEDIVEDKEVSSDGIPVCNDFTVAKYFLSPEELVEWAKENTSLVLEEGKEKYLSMKKRILLKLTSLVLHIQC